MTHSASITLMVIVAALLAAPLLAGLWSSAVLNPAPQRAAWSLSVPQPPAADASPQAQRLTPRAGRRARDG